MKRYDEKVLHLLLDKYENSLLYAGQNRRRQSIALSVKKTVFPEYFEDTEYEAIHAQLLEQEARGYLTLVWKNKKVGHILEKIVLCTDEAEQIYGFLHRKSRIEKEEELRAACRKNQGRHPLTDRYLAWILDRLDARESLHPYASLEETTALFRCCDLLLEILTNAEEVFLREFSVRFFKDSKAAEHELHRATAILARFWEDESLLSLEAEQILEEFGIYKNPSWVLLKGQGCFRMGEQCIDVSAFPGGLGLSSTDTATVIWNPAALPAKVVTIENLTSFHRFTMPDALAVYLGGYHNRVKREFLRGLYESAQGRVRFYHFGDIDCGGFRILRDLRGKTGIEFLPIYMDEETYEKHLEFGKPLSANDVRELKRMAEDPYYKEQAGLFARMLKEEKKLEQECIQGGSTR